MWYDLHAAVLGIIKDPSTLQVGVAQLRVAHIADVQEPIPQRSLAGYSPPGCKELDKTE